MSGRALNEFERKLHRAALSDPKQELTAKQSEAIVPDLSARRNALNFLLGVGLFKAMKDAKGNVSFRVVLKNEMNATKDLGGEESLVLNHIKSSNNEGIWTKHLKAKTDLHQTVIDRCLKTLMQKQLIKVVKSVKHPTRKIYMLAHLDPSVELTGGPWYTDNELDTEFIKLLCNACLRFIQDNSFPKRRGQQSQSQNQLFPISSSPQYPTAQTIQQFLKRSRITETQLSVEHIEMLLNVLVLDGEVEKIPAYGASMWDTAVDDTEDRDNDDKPPKGKRKLKEDHDQDSSRKRKRRKKAVADSSSDDDPPVSKKAKNKMKRKADDSDSDGDESKSKGKKRRKKEKDGTDDKSSSSSEDENLLSRKSRKSRTKPSSSGSESHSSSTESESRVKRNRSKSHRSSKSRKLSPSPSAEEYDLGLGSAHVYRAIRPERVALGWSQAPCSKCPSFDFCNDKGPVNARECVYYGDWLSAAAISNE